MVAFRAMRALFEWLGMTGVGGRGRGMFLVPSSVGVAVLAVRRLRAEQDARSRGDLRGANLRAEALLLPQDG